MERLWPAGLCSYVGVRQARVRLVEFKMVGDRARESTEQASKVPWGSRRNSTPLALSCFTSPLFQFSMLKERAPAACQGEGCQQCSQWLTLRSTVCVSMLRKNGH